jgi:DUF4097 and DUF4098 domain-containing protein YvlB
LLILKTNIKNSNKLNGLPMNSQKLILSTLMASLLTGCIVIAKPSRANVELEEELAIAASDIKHLDIAAGAGELRVVGSDTAQDISVKAHIYTTSSRLEDYDLSLKRNGDKAYLVAKHNNTSGSWIGSSPHIDITVTAPSNLRLTIDDGSGDMWVNNFNGKINVKDGSGDIEITSTNGELEVNDGSGSIKLNDIVGNLDINDGSGELLISNIQGNVDIDDGSGQISASNVDGYINVKDGSGDMTIRNISGEAIIDDGSGDIDISDVGGLKIIEEGSGDLRVNKVNGSFEIGH